MITDTSKTCREKREPLSTESNYFFATFDSISVWVPSRGQYRSIKQIKAGERETRSPLLLPSSWGTQAGNFLISDLGSVQKEERE